MQFSLLFRCFVFLLHFFGPLDFRRVRFVRLFDRSVGADDQAALIPETEDPQATAGFELKEAVGSGEVLEFGVIGGWSLVGGEVQQSQQLLKSSACSFDCSSKKARTGHLSRFPSSAAGRAMARMVNRSPWRMGSVLRLNFTYK